MKTLRSKNVRELLGNRCGYCGEETDIQKEHIVARCFFPLGSARYLYAPACKECNLIKSKIEGTFRDFLVSDYQGSLSPAARLLTDTMMRSAKRNGQHFARDFVKEAERKPLFTKGGILVGYFHQARLKTDFVEQALWWIVRGLYWIMWEKPMPLDIKVVADRLGIEDFAGVNPFREKNGLSPWFHIENVFAVSGSFASDDPDCSVWFMVFYERVAYRVLAGRSEDFGNENTEDHSD